MSRFICYPLVALALCCLLNACQKNEGPEVTTAAQQVKNEQTHAPEIKPEPVPPTPPILETFDGKPQLSLFPRIGDYRPADDEEDRLPYWKSFLEHLSKASGIATPEQGENRVFILRTIRSLDAVGFFSPVATRPGTSYRVIYKIKAELPEGASTGIGIIEYDQFLWAGEQYTENLDTKHRVGVQEGLRLKGSFDWKEAGFEFTTGPKTEMVHLVFFREGTTDRSPVLIDDILIEPIK